MAYNGQGKKLLSVFFGSNPVVSLAIGRNPRI
jgi:hypothetical protein